MATPITRLRSKCDNLARDIALAINPLGDKCWACKVKKANTAHHFILKSLSAYLRYCFDNLIPICSGCHCKHHNGDPEPHVKIIRFKGDKWFDSLQKNRRQFTKVNLSYYKNKYEELCETQAKLTLE